MTVSEATVIIPRARVTPGTTLNGIYRVDQPIAAGGMGEVYKGANIQTGDTVAIKMIRSDLAENESALALFRKEASALHNLQHEAIVRYYLFSVDPVLNRAYLSMEFVDGVSLKDVLAKAPLPFEDVREIQQRIGSGLHAAHKLGIIHRDVSPDNVILPDGRVSAAKILDFGIARSTKAGEQTIIGSGFAGKYNYVSPEQLGLAGGDVTGKSDIYSFGLLLAECLQGRPLDMNGSQVEVIDKRRVVPDLSGIDARFRPLIARMLQPLPRDRPESMAEVAAWEPATTKMGRLRAGGSPNGGGRRKGIAIAAGLAVLALLGGGAWFGSGLIGGSGGSAPVAGGTSLADEEARAAEAARRAGEELRRAALARGEEERRLDEQAKLAAERKQAEEARLTEERRQAEEVRLAAEAAERKRLAELKLAEEQRVAEEKRIAEEKRGAEELRLAEERRAAEDKRVADQKRAAEEKRAADEKRLADEKRAAEEKRVAEEKRLGEERRRAEARAAEEKRVAEERRVAEEKRLAEERRHAEARAAEEKRVAEEKRIAEEKRVAELKAAEERRKAEALKAAEEKTAQERQLAEERRAAEQREIAAREAAELERQAAIRRAEEEQARVARAEADAVRKIDGAAAAGLPADAEISERQRLALEQAQARWLAEEAEALRRAGVSAPRATGTPAAGAEDAIPQPEVDSRIAAVDPSLLVPPPIVPAKPVPSDEPALIRETQEELTRIGCYSGRITGTFNRATRQAVSDYRGRAGLSAQPVAISGEQLLDLRQRPNATCPAVQPQPARPSAPAVVRRPPREEPTRRAQRPAPAPARAAANPPRQAAPPTAAPAAAPRRVTPSIGLGF